MTSSKSGAWAVVAAGAAALAGCATGGAETPPDRPLFRLDVSGVAPVVAASVDGEPGPPPRSGPPVAAYTAEFRVTRGDGVTLMAPRLTTFAGQRANIQVLNQVSYIQDFDVEHDGDAWIADPVIGVLQGGWTVELTVLDAADRPGEAALAYSVRTCDVRRPWTVRTIGPLSPSVSTPVTIQLPRYETAQVLGARRLVLGEETEIARLPDPSGVGEIVVRGRITRITVPGPADDENLGLVPGDAVGSRPDDDEETRARGATLRALGTAAAQGTASRALRVTAVRFPAGVDDPDAPGVERLATLAVASVLGPGATASDRLAEAYVADWDVDASGGGVCDPVIGTHDSGITATVADDGALRVAWRTTQSIPQFTFFPFARSEITNVVSEIDPTFRLTIDRPLSMDAERTVPLTPGRTVHPVFRLPDGGTAAVVVEVGDER